MNFIKRDWHDMIAYDRKAYRLFMDDGRPGYAVAVLIGLWVLRLQPLYLILLAWTVW